ncbi:MAG: YdcF family protein [Oscillospiraceae bacterium]|nr:YdcF family protein [Oscillospiraceae bacterium]
MPIKKDVPGSVWIKRLFLMLLITGIVGMLAAFSLSSLVKSQSAPRFLTVETAKEIENVDCILVLGCGIREDGTPSAMLQDRLDVGIALYQAGVSDKLLMSGDHGRNGYDEVSAMKIYAMKQGVPSEDIFMDHAGFSTYESMVRAKEIFGVKKCVVVTQEYHLYRGIYNGLQQGIDTYGCPSDPRAYAQKFYRETREILARSKDVFYNMFSAPPTCLGDPISLDESGNVTNDDTFLAKLEEQTGSRELS